MSDFSEILKLLAGSGSGGGPVGTAQEPWNPAAKLASGAGSSGGGLGKGGASSVGSAAPQPPDAHMAGRPASESGGQQPGMQIGQGSPAGTLTPGTLPQGSSIASQMGPSIIKQIASAVMPNTMAGVSGKGGGISG